MATSKERNIMAKFIIQNYKPLYERLKRDCKHQIMITGGKCHVVVVIFKDCVLDNKNEAVVPISLNFEIAVLPVIQINKVFDSTQVYAAPMILYQPDGIQCNKWAKSTEARKAFIKEVLMDLKQENV